MALGKADLVFYDGRIQGHPASDSIAIAGDRIMAHGTFADLKPLVGSRTRIIRLAGRSVLPGLIDCHLHFLEAASAATGARLSGARTVSELLSELRRAASRTPPGNWLRAFGCDEALLRDRRGPTRAELDAAVPRNPLRLRHQTLHASWLNSRAIAALGLEAANFTPPPEANLVRSETGALSGLVVGMEQWLTAHLPLQTPAEIEARSKNFSRELAIAGVTSITDANAKNGIPEIELFCKLRAAGAISQNVSVMLGASHFRSTTEARKLALAGGIRISALKFLDARNSLKDASEAAGAGVRAGVGAAFHATELDELDAALEIIQGIRIRFGRDVGEIPPLRIEHGGVIPPDVIGQITELGAWVVTNPGFIYFRGPKYGVEPGLGSYLYPAKSLLDAGIPVAAGTDAPVTPARPMAAVAAAIGRTSFDGQAIGPDERLEAATALSLFTSRAAALTGLNAGEIQAEKRADLAIFPADPLAIDLHDLVNLQADITIVGGRVIYERGRPGQAGT